MFGIAKPCRRHLSNELYTEWLGHQCGLCLSLRDHHGQAARLTTNTDAIVLSVLVSAQRRHGVDTVLAGPCPLRGMKPATVVAPGDVAAVHAAAVSLTMAATKVGDHARDGQGIAGRLPGAAQRVGRRWQAEGDDLSAIVGFDPELIRRAIEASNATESVAGASFDDYVRATEDAAAAAFVHTAVLAGRPDNIDALDALGRSFGRLTYLFDAVTDRDDDARTGSFNPLAAAGISDATEIRRLVDDAQRNLEDAFGRLDLARPDLARALLVDQLRRTARRVIGSTGDGDGGHRCATTPAPSGSPAAHRSHRHGRSRSAGLAANVRLAAQVGLATIGALGATLAIFTPENQGGEIPFDPNQVPPQQPPAGMAEPAQSGFQDVVDAAGTAACCCCDCDCCDCDCCDCCDCDC